MYNLWKMSRTAFSVCACMCYVRSAYLCGKVVYDSDRDTGITCGRTQRNTESIRYKSLETPLCTDLDQSTATVTTDLKSVKHTHVLFCFLINGIQRNQHLIFPITIR